MSGPLHRRIYADLERRILSGDWAPGQRIPFEHELTAAYGCSRMTVNKAISELAGRGLVTRRRRAGTFVAQPKAHAAVLAIPDLRAEVVERGQAYGYRLLERRERDAATEEESDLARDGRLLDLACLHSADGAPLALERRLIALSAAPEAARVDFGVTPPGSWLLDQAPWTEAENRIAAVEAESAEARLLGLKTGAACLRVERRTWRDGQGVTRVWQTFPGDRYDLIARFSSRGDRR
ncbi:MAG: histidine utilization repressor [Brevundimonas sp.]|uniref:histidine utilization repressor n=1 Tax=Brevundimonas sp. TaxID=1871086 RepID=UPI0025854412|nr:histidine utilization repressor [Brevundimonas sp.]MCV0413448.1 histidine utilization repressor [Brevundimonas sp.]